MGWHFGLMIAQFAVHCAFVVIMGLCARECLSPYIVSFYDPAPAFFPSGRPLRYRQSVQKQLGMTPQHTRFVVGGNFHQYVKTKGLSTFCNRRGEPYNLIYTGTITNPWYGVINVGISLVHLSMNASQRRNRLRHRKTMKDGYTG